MDLSLLKSLFTSPSLSLANYLPGGSQSATAPGGGTGSTADSLLEALEGDSSSSDSDSVDLSTTAQQILATINGTSLSATSSSATTSSSSSSTPSLSTDQKAAQSMISSFLSDSGVDTSTLSDQAQQLFQGFDDVISNSGATTRDLKTDTMEQTYQDGSRKVFTLTGNNTRLRIAVDYSNGKPSSMTITDINGSNLDSAVVTLSQDGSLTPSVNVVRSQQSYLNGALASSTTPTPLSINLYQTSDSSSG